MLGREKKPDSPASQIRGRDGWLPSQISLDLSHVPATIPVNSRKPGSKLSHFQALSFLIRVQLCCANSPGD